MQAHTKKDRNMIWINIFRRVKGLINLITIFAIWKLFCNISLFFSLIIQFFNFYDEKLSNIPK